MSKIFDAYKKRAGESVDLAQQVSRAGTFVLFPPPSGDQQTDFSQLANRILGHRMETRGSVIGFAATASGEGSSFVSYNAAMVLAHTYHQKVAWIDGNFLSPQVKLNTRNTPSFSSLLQDPEQVENLIVGENPFLIGAGSNLVSSKGMLADDRYRDMMDQLAGRFDFVIVDLPPVMETRDTALMAAGTDGLLLVIEQKYLKREIVEHGIKVLRDEGVRVMGTVINRRVFLLPKVIYDRL